MRNPEKRSYEAVPSCLFLELPSVRQPTEPAKFAPDAPVTTISRVLNMPRAVGDDELSFRGCEVSKGDVDRDSLLAFGSESVRKKSQIEVALPALCACDAQGFHLVAFRGMALLSCKSLPISVLLPSSTFPAVMNFSSSIRNSPASCGLPWRLPRSCHRP